MKLRPRDMGAFTYYVITKRRGISKMFMHDYGRGGEGWSYGDISK